MVRVLLSATLAGVLSVFLEFPVIRMGGGGQGAGVGVLLAFLVELSRLWPVKIFPIIAKL